ncbi:hypothetical protein ACLBWT_17655 [Paenibacillus sp. D51F]
MSIHGRLFFAAYRGDGGGHAQLQRLIQDILADGNGIGSNHERLRMKRIKERLKKTEKAILVSYCFFLFFFDKTSFLSIAILLSSINLLVDLEFLIFMSCINESTLSISMVKKIFI